MIVQDQLVQDRPQLLHPLRRRVADLRLGDSNPLLRGGGSQSRDKAMGAGRRRAFGTDGWKAKKMLVVAGKARQQAGAQERGLPAPEAPMRTKSRGQAASPKPRKESSASMMGPSRPKGAFLAMSNYSDWPSGLKGFTANAPAIVIITPNSSDNIDGWSPLSWYYTNEYGTAPYSSIVVNYDYNTGFDYVRYNYINFSESF
jgi:hypothetical protein